MARQRDIIDIELWRDVPGWDGYQASSHGRVRRIVPEQRPIFAGSPHKRTRYSDVVLRKPNGLNRRLGTHVIVCQTFHGPSPSEEHMVAHNDGSRTNNRPDNLRWATAAENAADRKAHGTECWGERHVSTTLTNTDVLEIRTDYRPGYGNLTRLAEKYGVTRGAVWRIVNRRNWKHI